MGKSNLDESFTDHYREENESYISNNVKKVLASLASQQC